MLFSSVSSFAFLSFTFPSTSASPGACLLLHLFSYYLPRPKVSVHWPSLSGKDAHPSRPMRCMHWVRPRLNKVVHAGFGRTLAEHVSAHQVLLYLLDLIVWPRGWSLPRAQSCPFSFLFECNWKPPHCDKIFYNAPASLMSPPCRRWESRSRPRCPSRRENRWSPSGRRPGGQRAKEQPMTPRSTPWPLAWSRKVSVRKPAVSTHLHGGVRRSNTTTCRNSMAK